jgi:hypothetical protein
MAEAASPSSHSSFCEEVFSVVAGTVDPGAAITDRGDSRMRWTGQIFWLLAFGPALAGRAFFPPSPPKKNFGDWPSGKLYPVTAAQLLPVLTGFLAPIHFSKLAKN